MDNRKMIYLDDAIDAIKALWNDAPSAQHVSAMFDCEDTIRALPSAQLEIIHCGDCRYKDDVINEDGIPFLKCLHGRSYGCIRINDFCSWAERTTDD